MSFITNKSLEESDKEIAEAPQENKKSFRDRFSFGDGGYDPGEDTKSTKISTSEKKESKVLVEKLKVLPEK